MPDHYKAVKNDKGIVTSPGQGGRMGVGTKEGI